MPSSPVRRAPWLTAMSLAVIAVAIANYPAHAQSLDSSGVRAVPTYEAVGLYWSNPGANSTTGCEVKYQASGSGTWRQGLNLWFDSSRNECRGSLVNLTSGTSYVVQLNLPGAGATKGITFSTWSNTVPVASTVKVPSGSGTLTITQGGSAGGYVVYDGTGSTLDAQNGSATNINVNASYVIVRGFTLRGAQQHGILIDRNQHDVIIEDNDISGWGRTRDGTWGTDMDSGIRAICQNEELTRVTVQRNRIHDPRYSANSWAVAHPAGPQGITFSYCGGNHVFRWNEVTSTNGNHYNDGMGGEDNFSTAGFPNKDSDVYGNRVENTWDDGLEIEGGDQNVRVWGNYVNNTGTGIASTVDSVGPLYIFRNVWNRNQFMQNASCDSDQKQPMFKSGSSSDFGNGRRYLFHNTMLQAQQSGCSYGLGGGAGVGGTGDSQLVHNTVSINNIYHLWKPNGMVYQVGGDNTFQNDMYNGSAGTAIISGINAAPTYAAGNGWQNESGGQYALAPGTPGYDQGLRIPNFNDDYRGAAPDVGAVESGGSGMKFGLVAATAGTSASSSGSSTTTTTPTTPTPPVDTPTPPATGSGSNDVRATIDSSSYTVNAGQGVTFVVNVSGSYGTPTGSVVFRDNGSPLAGCSAVAVSGGTATCSTAALGGGAHAITGLYTGDSTYSAGIAGPITQTVNGSISVASASASPNVGGLWWGAANGSESGWGVNLVQQGSVLFATWFTYDHDGSAMWLVMPNAQKAADGSYSGTLYRTTGPSYRATSFDPSQVGVTAVGSASFSFTDANNGRFNASVNGSSVSKALVREVYDTVPSCTADGSAATMSNFQDLWWRTSGSESGWGLQVTQQGNTVFLAWFTYDDDGKGLWLVASNMAKMANGTYTGTLYRTTGPAFDTAVWNTAAVGVTPVGSATLAFSGPADGMFTATVNGNTVSKPVSREVFSSPATVCR